MVGFTSLFFVLFISISDETVPGGKHRHFIYHLLGVPRISVMH